MRVGLVLGGGSCKGAYQIGFVKALLEYIDISDIKALSCSSIGIINGYALVSNKLDKAYDLWRGIDFESPAHLISSVWKKNFFNDVINAIAEPTDNIEIPFYCSVCFLPSFKLKYYKLAGEYDKKWFRIIKSATYFPVISGNFSFFRGQLAVDGGMMDNIPLYPLAVEEDLDLIFVLHFQSQYEVPLQFRNKKTVIIDLDVSSQNKFRRYFIEFNNAVITDMLESGYQYGKSVCERIFANGQDLTSIRNAVSEIYAEEKPFRKANPNLGWVSKLNFILKPFVRTKNIVTEYHTKVKKKLKGVKPHGILSYL